MGFSNWIDIFKFAGVCPAKLKVFFGEKVTSSQLVLADSIAYVIIVAVLLLLAWTIIELYKGNKKI